MALTSEEREEILYNMQLMDKIENMNGYEVLRVPSGWIFTRIESMYNHSNPVARSVASTFVPYYSRMGQYIDKP